jgi:hypothetical protein
MFHKLVDAFGHKLALLERDRRILTSVVRCSQKKEKTYARCTAVERVNCRVDQLLGFEHHPIRGQAKMEMRMGLALVVTLAMALGRIRAGQAELKGARRPVEACADGLGPCRPSSRRSFGRLSSRRDPDSAKGSRSGDT